MSDTPPQGQPLGRTEQELSDILRREPTLCPICVVITRGMRRSIDSLFYENVNDRRMRDEIRKGGGFCRYHAQMVSQHGDALGSAIILEDLVKNFLRNVERGDFDGRVNPGLLSRLSQRRREAVGRPICMLCAGEIDMENLAIDALYAALRHGEVADLFRESHALCIPHFRRAAERRQDPGWAIVMDAERRALRALVNRLDGLAKTYDYQSRSKPAPELVSSWREGLNITSSWIDLCG